MDDITRTKLRVFEEVLFELKDRNTEKTYVPKHPKLKRTIFGLIYSFAQKGSFKEFEMLSSAVTIAWEALDRFHLTDDAKWETVISGQDKLNLNRIVKAIIRKVEHELPEIANPNTKRMYDPETGGKVFVTIDFDSLDRTVYDNDGNPKGELGEFVTESFFAPKPAALRNPFLEWFRNNRTEFLTARQNEFIDGLSTGLLKKDSEYIGDNDFDVLAGMRPNEMDHMKKRIKERTIKAWDEHRGNHPESSRRGAYLLGKIAELQEVVALTESDDKLETQNARLSEWVRNAEREHGEDWIDFIYDTLSDDVHEVKAFVRYLKGECESIQSAVLYTIYEAIIVELDRLKRELRSIETVVPVKFVNEERRKHNAALKKRYDDFTEEQPCFVYNREGELLHTMKSNGKEYKIKGLDAFGCFHDLN
ncbi:hypothetical protein [Bacillus sp. ISL-37]|uniref:hypothetical protein n=1 Tax=Bacillus sp. ISL-37 TaxID=2819123 RepID=UPI001BEC68CF|nr:hypothetical protein [Bacillus sp. ISL-37]MBT2682644.1 hypothetical protein [Bacillus sp. ISL-37]